VTTPEALLELQLTDSAIDDIGRRLPRLPDVVASNEAAAAVQAWERRRRELDERIAGFEAAIGAAETAGATLTKQIQRLEQQLKTVIAPREAEALMHEIELLKGKRSTLDDAELEAFDGIATAEAERAEHDQAEADLRAAAAAALDLADAARAASAAELADTIARRDAMRAALDPDALKRYDTTRLQHNGVAIAKLNGLRCEACHLDLSRGEVDNIKRLGPEELPECPNCGRLLVR
jgi:predicted  nucleic acid-binding Zn-ribbon protein